MAAKSKSNLPRDFIPPHNLSAEQSVLGGVMLDPSALDIVSDVLVEADFYVRGHQLIYRAILELRDAAQPFDAVTLGEWFERQQLTELIGGSGYLVELASNTPSAANVKAYAKIVADKATLRRVIEAGSKISTLGLSPEERSTEAVVAEVEQIAFAIAEAGRVGTSGIVTARDSGRDAFAWLQQRYENQGSLVGLPSGYGELDEMLSGLNASDLIVIAGRPSMGKTTLGMCMAEEVAIRQDKAVAVFSMEMSATQLTNRLISSLGRVSAQKLRSGQLEDPDWARVNQAIRQLNSKLLIDPTPGLTPEAIRARARRLKREHDIQLVVVDYLQLMQANRSAENRNAEISEISRSLKALAKELDIPVVALSQLNRGVEGRTEKRPLMSDLRESGAIEQDADVIMFIYRDEYYHPDSADKGLAEIIVAKQRNGPTGTVKLRYSPDFCRFDNLAR